MNNRLGFEIARDDFLYGYTVNNEAGLLTDGEPYVDEFGRWCQDVKDSAGDDYTLVMINGDIELHSI